MVRIGLKISSKLVEQARDGNESAVNELLKQSQPFLITLLERESKGGCLKDHVDSMLSEVQSRILKGIRSINNPDQFAYWVTSIARNEVRSHIRREHIAVRKFSSINNEEILPISVNLSSMPIDEFAKFVVDDNIERRELFRTAVSEARSCASTSQKEQLELYFDYNDRRAKKTISEKNLVESMANEYNMPPTTLWEKQEKGKVYFTSICRQVLRRRAPFYRYARKEWHVK